jgi:hypothetical protein
MTFNSFLPPKIWTFLVKIAEENKLSIKEVERIFLTKVAKDLGFACDHERIGRAKKDPDHKPYCKDCWARLRMEKREPYRVGNKLVKEPIRHVEKMTFLDEFYKEQHIRKEIQKESPQEPHDSDYIRQH